MPWPPEDKIREMVRIAHARTDPTPDFTMATLMEAQRVHLDDIVWLAAALVNAREERDRLLTEHSRALARIEDLRPAATKRMDGPKEEYRNDVLKWWRESHAEDHDRKLFEECLTCALGCEVGRLSQEVEAESARARLELSSLMETVRRVLRPLVEAGVGVDPASIANAVEVAERHHVHLRNEREVREKARAVKEGS